MVSRRSRRRTLWKRRLPIVPWRWNAWRWRRQLRDDTVATLTNHLCVFLISSIAPLPRQHRCSKPLVLAGISVRSLRTSFIFIIHVQINGIKAPHVCFKFLFENKMTAEDLLHVHIFWHIAYYTAANLSILLFSNQQDLMIFIGGVQMDMAQN